MKGWWTTANWTNAVVFDPVEAVSWLPDGVGTWALEDGHLLSFTVTAGVAPLIGAVILGGTFGGSRTLTTDWSAGGAYVRSPSDALYLGENNEIAYGPAEPVSWGTGSGVFTSERTRFVFKHTTGTDPAIGSDIIGGATTAEREIVTFITSPVGEPLTPQRLPFAPGANNLTAIAWSVNLVTWASAMTPLAQSLGWGAHFRFALTYLGGLGGTVFFSFKNVSSTGATLAGGIGAAGREMDWNVQFNPTGMQLLTPNVFHPFWSSAFGDPDNIGNVVWGSFGTKEDFPLPPITVRCLAQRVGFVTDPIGDNFHSPTLGTLAQLRGSYATWDVFTEIVGYTPIPVKIGRLYLPRTASDSLDESGPIVMHQEYFTQYPNTPVLTDDPVDIRYYDIRVFDGTSWHLMNEWRIGTSHLTPDPYHGWMPSRETGKLSLVAGFAGATYENTDNNYVLTGLTYERADTFAALPFVAVGDFVVTGATYNGPYWHAGLDGSYPLVLQDRIRGWHLMHPSSTVGSCVSFTALAFGTYRFVGDFARGTTSLSGNGVAVSVRVGSAVLFSSTIPASSGATVNVNAPFAGAGWQHFDVQVTLTAGSSVRFIVDALGGDAGFDGTVFRVSTSYIPLVDENFTGWGGHRGTAGRDRAVKCPRCGMVLREADLVTDGVTHTQVCTSCYDPPTPPPNFRWPFRT